MVHWLKHVCIGLLLTPSLCTAFSISNDAFLNTEKLLKKRQYSLFDQTFPSIQQHPLAPYLEAKRLQTQFYKKPIQQIDDFLTRYKGQQPAIELQKKWVIYLAKKQEWSLFLSYYTPTSNLTLQCHRIKALESTKRQFDAIKEGQDIWLLGVSLPKTCDKVFKNWERHGFLSQDLIWQRLVTATQKRQYKLVRYLTKKLSTDYKKNAYLLKDLWRYPEKLLNYSDVQPLTSDIRFLILNKLLKKQPDILFNHNYEKHLNTQDYDEEQQNVLTKTAIHSYALKSEVNNFNWYELAKTKQLLDLNLKEAFLQGAINNSNWPLYTHLFKLMNNDIHAEPKWLYWQGRALQSLGANAKEQNKFYQQAATHRDFYGFLASQKIGIIASMNHTPSHVPASLLQRVRLLPGVKRALALYELNRTVQARREWQTVFDAQTDEAKEALAILAGRLDWSDRAIMGLAKIKSWHDLQLRFPLAHDQYFDKAAQKNNINKHWIYGIARQESAFMHDVRSSAGATGLMQLMPKTAKSVSKKMRIPYSKKKLIDPAYNIKLGSRYLQYLLKRYDGNRVLATAAYNAGPGNVNRWLKRFNGDIDIWIEQIPFKETKEYVQRVLTYSTIYSYRLGFLQPVLDDTTLTAWAQIQPAELKISKANIKQNGKG
ncbi:lytic transglycosylase Slt [Oceaniserpentilla sp. 4NH20-0058]|uniref:transglycosylase SLT domain-containing protein n=1 Tax=Oceaniserpentilla sp. 4NH20-0058 TaxID=3127660 RepID=UPI0031052A65